MKFWRRSKRAQVDEPDTPDVEGAREELARIRSRRADVDALVASLIVERHLNNFSANLTATLRGGRR